jgi:hypothetical protein
MSDKLYEVAVVKGPDGTLYRIPAPAQTDWDAWIDIAGSAWVPPNYAKVHEDEDQPHDA